MRNSVLLACAVLFFNYGNLLAQNKTLGVGAATPNANAALHVESPTGNQGFLMPRLTTLQREAMIPVLTAADEGLILFDTDRSIIFTWDGTGWKSSSEYLETNPASTTDVVNVLNKGLGIAGKFKNENIGSKMPAVWAETNSDSALSAPIYGLNSGTGDVAASFRIMNTASSKPALFVETDGTGGAATFRKSGTTGGSPAVFIDSQGGSGIKANHNGPLGFAAVFQTINASNTNAAMFVESVGSGQSIFAQKSLATSTGNVIYAEHLGSSGSAGKFLVNNVSSKSPSIWAETNSDSVLSAPIYGRNTGTGDVAASFRIENAANRNSAAFAETNGSGPAVFASQVGTGRGGQFQITNTLNANAALRSYTDGTGNAGFFTINNTASTTPGILTTTNGSGAAIMAENNGAADGFAGLFSVRQSTNTFPAIQASSVGTGSGVRVIQDVGTGPGMDVYMKNTTSTAPGFSSDHAGLGNAGSFSINNATSKAAAIYAVTNGAGPAINATHTGGLGDAMYVERQGAGGGSAGNFRISNTQNTASSVYASTTAPGGVAIGVNNEANGVALAIWGGGMRVSTSTLSAGTLITTRASAYLISGGGPYTFDTAIALNEGELFYFLNTTLADVDVAGAIIPANSGKTCIFLGGALRAL
jgi:hypothetical protein